MKYNIVYNDNELRYILHRRGSDYQKEQNGEWNIGVEEMG